MVIKDRITANSLCKRLFTYSYFTQYAWFKIPSKESKADVIGDCGEAHAMFTRNKVVTSSFIHANVSRRGECARYQWQSILGTQQARGSECRVNTFPACGNHCRLPFSIKRRTIMTVSSGSCALRRHFRPAGSSMYVFCVLFL